MKVLLGALTTLFTALGLYLLIIGLVTLRVYHLNLVKKLPVKNEIAEANSYILFSVAAFCIAGALTLISANTE
jgi:hypothetical protein